MSKTNSSMVSPSANEIVLIVLDLVKLLDKCVPENATNTPPQQHHRVAECIHLMIQRVWVWERDPNN